jgi:RNA polymerase sigma factor (sigma-70 family)
MTLETALQALRSNPHATDAWDRLVTEVYQPLLVYVAALLLTFRVAPGETAHDIVHEVLIGFYQRWPASKARINSVEELSAYLRRSCRNLLIDRYRREQRAGELLEFLTLKFSRAAPTYPSADAVILTDEIIGHLPEDCAQLFRCYLTDELSPAELAERAGASPATFYSRWYRCLRKAREIFTQREKKMAVSFVLTKEQESGEK